MVLLSEQEVIQALLFSSQADSTEKLRLFLEYLKIKGTAPANKNDAGDGEEELEEVHIEPLEEEIPPRRASPLMITAVPVPAVVKRGRGRPKLLTNRITVSCRPTVLSKPVPISKASTRSTTSAATAVVKRRGRPAKRSVIPKKAVSAMIEDAGLERLAASAAEVGIDIPLEADFNTETGEDLVGTTENSEQ